MGRSGSGSHEGHDHGHGDDDDEKDRGRDCDHRHHKRERCSPITRCRDIYLKIEKLPAYSPVAPDEAEHDAYKLDCMRNEEHENGRVPEAEVERRRMDAIVYREYLDAHYTVLKTDPLVPADINEPRAERRIPGTVIYASPGERLFVHVCNADDVPHSLHVHGLIYGIDSDGSWPFGVQAEDGRRSDAICPGQTWCYVFDVNEETIGAWPFHDHHMHIEEQVARGLFGGIVVRDPRCPRPDYEVPFFFHRLIAPKGAAAFDSGTLNPGATFAHTFTDEGTFDYFCQLHPMTARVRVSTGGAPSASVSILDGPSRFDPEDVTVAPGATVTWNHAGTLPHTVTDSGGAGLDSYAINGRTFVGNTPTIVARTGKRIRWYVFNLDMSAQWHNFHAHSQRWLVGDERMDTRSLGPAESFVADTIVPPVILLPLKGECSKHHHHKGGHGREDCGCGKSMSRKRIQRPVRIQPGSGGHGGGHGGGGHGGGGHGGGGHGGSPHHLVAARPGVADRGGHTAQEEAGSGSELRHAGHSRKVRLQGDFLVHCHVEMHMMDGMAAIVRAIQEVEVTPELTEALGFELPLELDAPCREVPSHPCAHGGAGTWETLPESPIFVVHAAVLHTGRLLLWSGTAEVGYPLESRVWDPVSGNMTTQTFGEDLFCAGHAFLADGRLCVPGGAPIGNLRATHIFDPVAENWTRVRDMAQARWYPTVLTLPDGRILAASGWGANEVEIYDAAADTWTTVAGATRSFQELYPSLHLLPSGQIFYSRAGWQGADMTDIETGYLTLSGPAAGSWTDLGQQQFYDRQEGMTVLQIDTTVTPPRTTIIAIGGGVSGPPTARNAQSAESIDLAAVGPAASWTRLPDMHFARTNVNVVLLPDGTLLVIGGQRNGKWASDPGAVLEAEIFDPRTGVWTPTAPMAFPRQYHSIAVLLPDGRVLSTGGVDPSPGAPQRDQRSMEVFSPGYMSMGTRPAVTNAPATAAYGATFDIDASDAASIDSVVLLRPGSVTHHTDAGQRYIRIPIVGRTANRLTVRAPADGNIAPPGYYMLFIVDGSGVPSVARFIRMA